VVEASIAGSIVGNMLLVLDATMLAGGVYYSEQNFNPVGARSEATMLTLAATDKVHQKRSTEKLRLNPRKTWYSNLEEVTASGEYEVTFRLKRPQPSFLALLGSGWSPVYPCHVSPRDMRAHPIGTGPFKFVEFRPNERIRVARNPEYWKPSRPYLDGIEWSIVPSLSTRILGFAAGRFDQVFGVTIPLLQDVKSQAPQAVCEFPANLPRTLLVNRTRPPFDNPELRRAMAFSLDDRAFIDIITLGQGDIGGTMQPPPEGVWGMPPEMLRTLPGYDPDVTKNRAQARGIMEKLGYGPDNRLAVKVSARNIAPTRDPAILLIGQLHDSKINGEVSWFFDGSWRVALGNPHNGIDAEATVGSPQDAAEWLRANAVRRYPQSTFAKRFPRSVNQP
jgi:peptide/nickel transport system substrate-binding protein